jgi:hypothetical protein
VTERRTHAPRAEREWLERAVVAGGWYSDAVKRVGFEAVLESMQVDESSGILWRIDLRHRPWANNPELKRLLREARVATSALREALDEVVMPRG